MALYSGWIKPAHSVELVVNSVFVSLITIQSSFYSFYCHYFLLNRSYLDLMKVLIFKYLFWIVLCLIFVTGTARISIFCVGYFVACFYFMHFGQSLQLKPIRDILRPWDYLIVYTTLVITIKNLLAVCSGLMFVINLLRRGKNIYLL